MKKRYSVRIKVFLSKSLLWIVLVLLCQFQTRAQIITSVAAGSGTAYKVCIDTFGNIYVGGSHRVRKVDPAGTITTIAGNGSDTYSGDGGIATAAGTGSIQGIAIDRNGNLYIAQTGPGFSQPHVRKVNAAGIITTVAGNGIGATSGDGGPATAASFDIPQDIAVDASGNIYIADFADSRIRKVDTTGIISTIVGTTSGYYGDGGPASTAQINMPEGVHVDRWGNVYIADRFNERIRKIDASGMISTIAGNGTGGFSGDGGPATAAQLGSIRVVSTDDVGNVYIIANNRIRKVDASGIINTIAGNGSGGDCGLALTANISFSTGIAIDKSRNIYLAGSGIRKIYAVGTTEITGSDNVCVGTTIKLKDSISNGVWKTSDSTIASIDSIGNIRGYSSGTATITYFFSGCFATHTMTVSDCPNEIRVIANTEDVVCEIVPNPNYGAVRVNFVSNSEEKIQIVITNVIGQKIKEVTTATNTPLIMQLDVPAGTYFISAITQNGVSTKKMILKQ